MSSKIVFVVADHGLALIFFLQGEGLMPLLDTRVEVVLLVEDALTETLASRGPAWAGVRGAQSRSRLELLAQSSKENEKP